MAGVSANLSGVDLGNSEAGSTNESSELRMKQGFSAPAEVMQLLAQADERHGFPTGTMAAVMQQEIGGNTKYLQDPSAYHYPVGPDGRRVAKHTRRVSTAFGPFGILESTAADPGYGVKPLQDKSLAEQVRFAGEYLAARARRAGGLEQGLASYGEGPKYSQAVMARLGVPGSPPQVLAQAPAPVNQAPVAQPMNQEAAMAGMSRYGNPEAVAYGGGLSLQQSLARLLM